MTLKEIAIFKHFIAEKDLRKPFIRVYRASHDFAKLPTQIEDFFSNVEPMAVILSACRVCRPNDIYGYDFWQDLHQDWKVYYNKYKDLGEDSLPTLGGYYKILRENWNDKDKPWRFEDLSIALARLGLDPIEPAEPKEESKPLIDLSETPEVEEEKDPLAGFDFVDVQRNYKGSRKINDDVVSINTRGGYRVLFCQNLSETIAKSGFKYTQLATNNKSNMIAIRFSNDDRGLESNYKNGTNVVINSKDFTFRIKEFFFVREDYAQLKVKEKIQNSDSLTFIISKS